MFTRILVPLDGSDRAEQAIPVAARIARSAGGSVILVQVAAPSIDFQAEEKKPSEIYSATVIEEVKARASNSLDAASRVTELEGVKTETRVVYGDVAPSLLAAVERLGADLVVMCSHGYTGFKRWALGSIAQKIIPYSSVPVLVLRDGGPTLAAKSVRVLALPGGGQTFPAKPVSALIALDGSPLAETVLGSVAALVAALAPAAQKTLHLMRVVDLPVTYGNFRADAYLDPKVKEEARREAHKYLATIAERLTEGDYAAYDLTVTTSVTVNPDVAEALTKTVEQAELTGDSFDLIAMATHGRGGLQRWVMGSVTERVLQATKLPMLVVHPARQSKRRPEPAESNWP